MLAKLPAIVLISSSLLPGAVISYTDEGIFLAALGPSVSNDFDSFATGTVITNQLAGIASVSTDGENGSVQAEVGSISTLPFPMSPSTHSGDNFLSSELAGPTFASAGLIFQLTAPSSGVGFWITDGSPLGVPVINLYSGAVLVGTASFGLRGVPDSFVGVTSTIDFDSFTVDSSDVGDSWGLDSLTIGTSAAVPEPATFLLAAAALGTLALGRRIRR